MTENNTPQDGFSIYRRTPRQTRTNKSRKDERVTLLNNVADGSISTDEALRQIGRTYSTGPIRFHHRTSRDNRIEISGIVSNQTITLCVDEWQKLGAYLSGINFKGFVERNEATLRTRRPPNRFKKMNNQKTSHTEVPAEVPTEVPTEVLTEGLVEDTIEL